MASLLVVAAMAGGAEPLSLQLRAQRETAAGSGRFHTAQRAESWKPSETALIVCDVWDYHHCLNAVRRLEEFGPRLNAVIQRARELGVTIIHSPSDCMPAYIDHPARRRAIGTPPAKSSPPEIDQWCLRIPTEELAAYPIDQSDGGEDDDPREHAEWAAKLKALGRNPGMPWKRQSDLITIDDDRDFLSDRGDEVWNVLERRGIRNVILTGVHTNMCVLGRPFGLRQMVRGGKNVVLLRDMTDSMYNPARWPYVSHYAGNDRVIAHVERYVCPTITSDQIIGGKPFRFAGDQRRQLAIVVAEDGYETDRTLPAFAARYLESSFRVSQVFGNPRDRNDIPGLEALDDADVLLVSVRRRTLKPEALDRFRRFVQNGKPVIGIRTASHAFQLKDQPVPPGLAAWPEFDAQVFGGNYQGHPGTPAPATIQLADGAATHPIVRGVSDKPFPRDGALYLTSPLAPRATPLWVGAHAGQPAEPVAWTFERSDGGKSFYTSLGEAKDFENPEFVHLLANAVHWSVGLETLESLPVRDQREEFQRHWTTVAVPATLADASQGVLRDYSGTAWYRCVIRMGKSTARPMLTLKVPAGAKPPEAWVNGRALQVAATEGASTTFTVAPEQIDVGEANLLVIRLPGVDGAGGLTATPLLLTADGERPLAGRWQLRLGDDAAWSNMPLPAKFGTATDVVFEP